MERDLLRQKLMVRTKGSISAGDAAANAEIVGNARNSAGVALLTDASVACAERMVAISSSCGALASSAHRASG